MVGPGNGVTLEEAAHILGVARSTVRRLILTGELTREGRYTHRGLDRDQVEELAMRRWRRHRPPPADSYWITTKQAAAMLGVSHTRVWQLAQTDRLPFRVSHTGVKLFRRRQLETIAHAWQARRRMPTGSPCTTASSRALAPSNDVQPTAGRGVRPGRLSRRR
jgi:excisionase family DNA binding protein